MSRNRTSTKPADEKTAEQLNETTNEQLNETKENVVIIENRNIVRVTCGEKNRYYMELDGKPFEGHNREHEVIETNSFSMDISTIAKEIGTKHELLNMAFAMASVNKGTLNPTIVALCLSGAKITLKRTLKLATDLRETGNENDTYGYDTWKNSIVDITPNIPSVSETMIISLVTNPKTLIKNEPNDDKKTAKDVIKELIANN